METMLEFARAYSRLGWAVQQQLDDILAGNLDDINPNAVKLIQSELGEFNNEINDACVEYFERTAVSK